MSKEKKDSKASSIAIGFYTKYFRDAIPADVAAEIGVATYGFSWLESIIDHAIYALLGDPPHGGDSSTGGMIVSQIGFRQKGDLFASLYVNRSRPNSDREGLKSVLTALEEAATLRNDIQHARFWDASEDFPRAEMMRFKLKPKSAWGLEVIGKPLVVETITEVVAQIAESTAVVADFWSNEKKALGYTD